MSAGGPDYVARNREHWTRSHAAWTGPQARDAWSRDEVRWGVWGRPESEVRALPEVQGLDVVELGCGTGYFGAILRRLGARRVVGVDLTPAQLRTARQMNHEFGLDLDFIEANAEVLPLAAERFDLAVSEYGASIWCDPDLWIPEAARVLRPGGELVFMRGSTLSMLCMPDTGPAGERLVRPQRGIKRLDWEDGDPGTEFHLPAGELVGVLRRSGFEIADLIEVYAPADADDHAHYDSVPAAWAQRWPAEEIWRVRKAGPPVSGGSARGAPSGRPAGSGARAGRGRRSAGSARRGRSGRDDRGSAGRSLD